MNSTSPNEMAAADHTSEVDASAVEQFLRQHPGFFQQHPELLLALDLPHGGAGSVSLIERQVNLLRERNIEMRGRLAELNQNAQANEALFSASRLMVLALLGCRNLEQLTELTEQQLKTHYPVDHVCLLWFDSATTLDGQLPNCSEDRQQVLWGLLRPERAYCGIFRAEEMQALFPGVQSEGSAALAPLGSSGEPLGILAVGSEDTDRYDSEVGTVFLEHLAEVLMALPLLEASSGT